MNKSDKDKFKKNKMTFDRQTREDILSILENHIGKSNVREIRELGDALGIKIQNLEKAILGEYSSIRNIPLSNAQIHYRNLTNAMSALLTFCRDRNLYALYDPEESKFTFSIPE